MIHKCIGETQYVPLKKVYEVQMWPAAVVELDVAEALQAQVAQMIGNLGSELIGEEVAVGPSPQKYGSDGRQRDRQIEPEHKPSEKGLRYHDKWKPPCLYPKRGDR